MKEEKEIDIGKDNLNKNNQGNNFDFDFNENPEPLNNEHPQESQENKDNEVDIGIDIDKSKAQIIINPNILYSGSNYDNVEVLGKFCTIHKATLEEQSDNDSTFYSKTKIA